MVNFIKRYFLVILILIGFSSCEKDDICEGFIATPNVRIEFYNKSNSTVLKPFYKIECYVEPQFATDSLKVIEFYNKSEIQLPLKISENQTVWHLKVTEIINNDTIQKTDRLIFDYDPQAEYVSKACGYKTVFNNLSTSLNNNGIGLWITNYTPLTNNIINEENSHAKIYY